MLTLPGIDHDQSRDFNTFTDPRQRLSWMPLGVISTQDRALGDGSKILLEIFDRPFLAELVSIMINEVNNQVLGKIYLAGATGEKRIFDISGFTAATSIAFVHIRYERRSLYDFLLGDNPKKKRGTE